MSNISTLAPYLTGQTITAVKELEEEIGIELRTEDGVTFFLYVSDTDGCLAWYMVTGAEADNGN